MLLPAGALANVYASLDRYCTEQLVPRGLTVRPHGVRRFVPPVDAPWVETHYDFLGLGGVYRRQIGRLPSGESRLGVERQGYLQLNLYQRFRTFTDRALLASARDLVVDAFPESGMIGIYNYADLPPDPPGEPERVGLIVLDGIQEHMQDTAYRSGVAQHVLQITTRYLEQFTRALA